MILFSRQMVVLSPMDICQAHAQVQEHEAQAPQAQGQASKDKTPLIYRHAKRKHNDP